MVKAGATMSPIGTARSSHAYMAPPIRAPLTPGSSLWRLSIRTTVSAPRTNNTKSVLMLTAVDRVGNFLSRF